MFCKNCGQKIPDGAKFCANCGGETAETKNVVPPVQPYTQVAPAKKSSSVGLIVGILLGAMAFLGLLVVGLFLIFRLLANSTVETPPEPIDDPVVVHEDIDVSFAGYSITLPYGTDYELSDDGVTFELDGFYYEFAIISQSYDMYKNNASLLIGREDTTTGMVINNAVVKTYDNTEYVELTGVYKSNDYTMTLLKSDLVPYGTIAVAKYGAEEKENETIKKALELMKTLKYAVDAEK